MDNAVTPPRTTFISSRARRDELLNFLRILGRIKRSQDPVKACEKFIQQANRRAAKLEKVMWEAMDQYEVVVEDMEEVLQKGKGKRKVEEAGGYFTCPTCGNKVSPFKFCGERGTR